MPTRFVASLSTVLIVVAIVLVPAAHAHHTDNMFKTANYQTNCSTTTLCRSDNSTLSFFREASLTQDVGAHRSEVGDRLLVAMFHMKDWGWTLMSGGVLLGADGRTKIDTDQTDIGHRIEGMTLPQLRETFRTAQPFAVVTKYRHLDPEARMRAVYEAGQKRGDAPAG